MKVPVVFQVPPGWPQPPEGWLPPHGWQPPDSWPPPPPGWTFYLEMAPAYRSRPVLIHPSMGRVHPAYRTSRQWGRRSSMRSSWDFIKRHGTFTVPLGVLIGLVACVAIVAVLGGGYSATKSQAVRACSDAVSAELSLRAAVSPDARNERVMGSALSVSAITEPSATTMAVTGSYRTTSGVWQFTCQASTAVDPPVVAAVDLSGP